MISDYQFKCLEDRVKFLEEKLQELEALLLNREMAQDDWDDVK